MSLVSHDLACDNGHRHDSVLHKRDVMPPCQECGAATHISWHSGQAPGINGFGTVNTGNAVMTTGEFAAHCRELEARNPGKTAKVVSLTDNEVDQRIDARKQRLADARKARGTNIEAVRDQRMDQLHREKEATVRATLPPEQKTSKLATLNTKIARTQATLTT